MATDPQPAQDAHDAHRSTAGDADQAAGDHPASRIEGVDDLDDLDDPEARLYTSEPLEDENGRTYVIQQQNVGPGREQGGGEWPDPHTPPQPPAPGAV